MPDSDREFSKPYGRNAEDAEEKQRTRRRNVTVVERRNVAVVDRTVQWACVRAWSLAAEREGRQGLCVLVVLPLRPLRSRL
jgi:hypothetical protein